jgi:hypothetical protein
MFVGALSLKGKGECYKAKIDDFSSPPLLTLPLFPLQKIASSQLVGCFSRPPGFIVHVQCLLQVSRAFLS